MNIDHQTKPAVYLKSKQGQGSLLKKNNFKVIAAILGILIFLGGSISVFLISQKQDTAPVAPNAPQSQPAAYIEKTQTCTLEFEVKAPEEVEKLACGEKACTSDADCADNLICVTTEDEDSAGNPVKYCAKQDYKEACQDDPSQESCCEEPEEVEKLACGEKACTSDADCADNLICVTTEDEDSAGNPVKYCAKQDYKEACQDDPSQESCCEEPEDKPTDEPTDEPTKKPTDEPTDEPTKKPTSTVTPDDKKNQRIVTTADCNESCQANADCSNLSHICYNGQCRLDVNPTDAQCKLPNGETVIVRPVEVPTQSGPANWLNYVKAGLGTLGLGALLLLLL